MDEKIQQVPVEKKRLLGEHLFVLIKKMMPRSVIFRNFDFGFEKILKEILANHIFFLKNRLRRVGVNAQRKLQSNQMCPEM